MICSAASGGELSVAELLYQNNPYDIQGTLERWISNNPTGVKDKRENKT